jgi:hypothetical protein
MTAMVRMWVAVCLAACGGGHAAPRDAASDAAIDATVDAPPDAPPACMANGLPGSCIDVAKCYGSRTATPTGCAAGLECCTPRFADGITCDPDFEAQPNQGLAEEPGLGGCPSGMAKVDTFCIDRFEASLMYNGTAWSPYFPPPDGASAVSLRGAVPQGYIDELQAASACASSGKRLCTDAEWLRACQGPTGTTYPYGNTREPGTCNDARAVNPAVELYGTTDGWIYAHLDSPCLNQLAHGLAPTGALGSCVTAEGVYDMMGNVHEWTDAPAGTFRGGDYVDTVLNGNGCLYTTTAHDATYWDYSTGFRCCAD